MVKLEFYDPSGSTSVAYTHAHRLDTLEGKRIGFVSNDQWQAYRMLPMLQTWLAEDFPSAELIPLGTFPQGTSFIGKEETADLVKKSGADAVIIGNAA